MPFGWCIRQESNLRRRDFQSLALPTELPMHMTRQVITSPCDFVLLYETLLGGLTCCTCLFRVEGDRIWTCPEDLTLLFHRAALHITRRILTLISVGNLSIPRLFRISLFAVRAFNKLDSSFYKTHLNMYIFKTQKIGNIAVYVLRGILTTKLTVFQS